jgi:hypothetical protein
MLARHNKQTYSFPKHQQGNILVLFVISLLALFGMAALALDSGHMLLNKTRLQNIVDAAALHAAKELDEGASLNDARQAVIDMLQLNLAHTDLRELNTAIDLAGYDISAEQMTSQLNVEFSLEADPFVATSDEDARYLKVELAQLPLDNFLAQIWDFNKRVSASAVSGPSTALEECFINMVPMLVCADMDKINDPNLVFGLPLNELYLMKIGSDNNSPIGPGNFQLIRLGDNTGADDIRNAMAGEDLDGEVCYQSGDESSKVPTEPGNTVGPVAQGLNTRLGQWQGPVNSIDHPRDHNICQGQRIDLDADGNLEPNALDKAYLYANYLADSTVCQAPLHGLTNTSVNYNLADAKEERRIMKVVIGDCTGENHGSSQIDYVGSGCFFLSQYVENSGQESYVVGEFVDKCAGKGKPSGTAKANPGPYTIVLFHSPGSTDS